MATKEQVNNFINMIAPIAQEAYKELGKVLPSVAVGMACVECGCRNRYIVECKEIASF